MSIEIKKEDPKAEDPTDHLVIDIKNGDWWCQNCGNRYKMNLPCGLNVFMAAMEAWNKDHRNCKPKGIDNAIMTDEKH